MLTQRIPRVSDQKEEEEEGVTSVGHCRSVIAVEYQFRGTKSSLH